MARSPINRSHAEILLSWEVDGLKTFAREVLPYLMRLIEQAHNIRLRFIPGWNVIEKVRDDANATKHRLGTTLVYRNELDSNELKTVKLTLHDVHERIKAVESWLREIIRVTEKHTI